MIRFFFILLAVVAIVLAVLMSQTWLYVAAGVALLVALVLLVIDARRSRRKKSPYAYEPRSRDDDLGSLGITDIREKRETAAPASGNASPTPARPAAAEHKAEVVHKTPNGQPAGEARNEAEPLSLFLEALRAALGAHTVCLLAQEELALEYRVEAVAGAGTYLEPGDTFSTTAPLLTAGMSRRNLTFRSVAPEDVVPEHLGYYAGRPPALQHIALAPLARSDTPTTWFLLVDANEESFARQRATRALLPRLADLLALMLDVEAADEEAADSETTHSGAADEAAPVEAAPRPATSGNGAPADAEKPRPRSEIVAEEMEHARAEGSALALALVYLKRAEAVADRGPEALADAEEALCKTLEMAASEASGRVERFGELTYGIFLARPVDKAEAWAVQLEDDLAHAEAPLDGGVSVGLAMLQERHERAEDFRADATKALREAYDTGTCTILA